MGDKDDDNDTDNDAGVEGGGVMAMLSALAAQHRCGEKERMRRF